MTEKQEGPKWHKQKYLILRQTLKRDDFFHLSAIFLAYFYHGVRAQGLINSLRFFLLHTQYYCRTEILLLCTIHSVFTTYADSIQEITLPIYWATICFHIFTTLLPFLLLLAQLVFRFGGLAEIGF